METKITKFSKISNKIFLICSIYLISFIWLEYKIHSIKNASLIAIPITLLFLLVYTFLSKIWSAKNKKALSKSELKQNLYNQLIWGNSDTINKYILSILGYDNLTKISNTHYENTSIAIHFNFKKEVINSFDLANIIRETTSNSIIVVCLHSNITSQPQDKEICIIDLEKLCNLLGEQITNFPTNIKLKNKPKYRLKDLLCIALNKRKAKGYFLSSLMLIFLSLFTPYNIYYIIVSTVLLLLAIISRINTKFNTWVNEKNDRLAKYK